MKTHDPGLARVFSALIMGLGQLYNGQYGLAAFFFVCHVGMAVWGYFIAQSFLLAVQAADAMSSYLGIELSGTLPPDYNYNFLILWAIVYLPLWIGNIYLANSDATLIQASLDRPAISIDEDAPLEEQTVAGGY